MGGKLLQYLNLIWAGCTIPLVFILLITPPTLLVIPLPVRLRLKIVGPFWRLFALYSLKYGCWAQIHSEDHREAHLKVWPPQGLYIANHQSFLDIPLVLTQFQVPPVMKKEILHIPLLGLMAWAIGALPVSRGKRNSRKKVFILARDRLVKERLAVQYYPEGTRSKLAVPKPYEALKVTLIQLAWEEKIPVIPVSLYGTKGVVTPTGRIQLGKKIGIMTHASVDPHQYPSASIFARACWAQVVKGHDQLKASLEN